MAEPEDLLSDAARHATIHIRRLWLRYRPPPPGPPTAMLVDVAPRLDLLITALSGTTLQIRAAQRPPHPTMLARFFRRVQAPWLKQPIPATNGERLWLPVDSGIEDLALGNELYRVMALQQAARAQRGSAGLVDPQWPALQADAFLLLEAWAADFDLLRQLPGMAPGIGRLRQFALQRRPELRTFSPVRRPLEALLQRVIENLKGGEEKT